MLKPVIDIAADIKKQLFHVPSLADMVQKKEHSTVDKLVAWLKVTEDILQKKGYSECAALAGLRAKLFVPEFETEQRTARRKCQLRIAAEILYDAQQLLSGLMQPMEQKINEVRATIVQILYVFKPTGIFKVDHSNDFNNFIQGLWNMFKAHEQVGGAISKILSQVNQSDAIRILAEEIELE
jgi:hypothetical protein